MGFWPRTNCITVTLCPWYAWIKHWLVESLSNSFPKTVLLLFIFYQARETGTLTNFLFPLSILFAWRTIWHYLSWAAGMWELHWEWSAVSRWPFLLLIQTLRDDERFLQSEWLLGQHRRTKTRSACLIQVKCRPIVCSEQSWLLRQWGV